MHAKYEQHSKSVIQHAARMEIRKHKSPLPSARTVSLGLKTSSGMQHFHRTSVGQFSSGSYTIHCFSGKGGQIDYQGRTIAGGRAEPMPAGGQTQCRQGGRACDISLHLPDSLLNISSLMKPIPQMFATTPKAILFQIWVCFHISYILYVLY